MLKTNTTRIIAISTKCLIRRIHSCKSNRNDVDAIDEFTTQLLQKKSDKWELIRNNKNIKIGKINNIVNKTFDRNNYVDIKNKDKDKINELLYQALEINDRKTLISILYQCVDSSICPSFKIVEKIFSFCAQNELRDLIIKLKPIVQNKYPTQYELNSDLDHYLAEVIWLRGNITDSLILFEKVYRDNQYLRKKVRLMIKYLISNIISQRSEAALVTIIDFTEKLAKEYNDYFLLACVWQACFLSEWYADQCTSAKILDNYEQLSSIIINRIPFIIHFALRENQPDILHRLFEILLKYDLKSQYTRVLQTLFNYRFHNNDLRSCAEIIQWSLKLEVPLLSEQHEQFLYLLLGKQSAKKKEDIPKIPGTPVYQLKF